MCMKEINGTITLAYVEEDNRQRVIFRVIPLCTREGGVFHGGAEDFPDEGSLRIVPDKREQSTFKEHMREIGGLCAIQLSSEGKELMKVRQNRNYAPEQGERNQLAIYSDVICEFTEDGCFEVVEAGEDAADAMTAKVLLHKDKMLYGPVEKEAAQKATIESLKPFGNDRFLLHTVETPGLGKHLVYWDPEATLNWRQRRNSLRRRERAGQEEEAEEKLPKTAEAKKPAEEKPRKEKAEAAAKPERAAKVDPYTRRVERAAEILRQEEEKKHTEEQAKAEAEVQPQQAEKDSPAEAAETVEMPEPAPEQETPLPIGAKLDILDTDLPFEQQISRLEQPLSEGANRLTNDAPEPEEEAPEAVAHFSGTPLVKTPGKAARSKTKPENVHHVVEQQIRRQRDEVMGTEMGAGVYGMVENPIENLRACVDYIWQNADMRDQALNMLMENDAFTADMAARLRSGGTNLHAAAAAQEQLAEIEADRLTLLMQLETARANEKKFREEALSKLTQKKRDEVERLKNEVRQLEATRRRLSEATQALSSGTAAQVTDFLAAKMNCLSGAGEQRVLLSPVIGQEYTQQVLAEQLRVHMNDSGFGINEDEAMSLLISFALYDAVCLRARTLADAQLFATVMLESFGLQSVSATVCPGAYVEMISLLPEDEHRTPTVTVQPLGTETMSVFGHKTIYLTDERTLASQQDLMLPYPVINVPGMLKRAFGHTVEWTPVAPAALSSFAGIRADTHPMLSDAEKWFGELKRALRQAEMLPPDAMLVSMRRFIEVASRKVRGGFLAAADTAVCHWVVPLILMNRHESPEVAEALAGLPHAMDMLGIR